MKNVATKGQKDHRWTTDFPLGQNRGRPKAPVLLFDNTSIGSIELLTIAEMAKLLRISVSGVRRLQQGRHIPFHKVGGTVRFAKSDIASYLARNRVEAIGQ